MTDSDHFVADPSTANVPVANNSVVITDLWTLSCQKASPFEHSTIRVHILFLIPSFATPPTIHACPPFFWREPPSATRESRFISYTYNICKKITVQKPLKTVQFLSISGQNAQKRADFGQFLQISTPFFCLKNNFASRHPHSQYQEPTFLAAKFVFSTKTAISISPIYTPAIAHHHFQAKKLNMIPALQRAYYSHSMVAGGLLDTS